MWLACSSPAPREASVQGWPQGAGGWLRQRQVAHVATERQFHHGHIREAHVLGLPAASMASRRVKPAWEVSTGEVVVRRRSSCTGQHAQSSGCCFTWSSASSPFTPQGPAVILLLLLWEFEPVAFTCCWKSVANPREMPEVGAGAEVV